MSDLNRKLIVFDYETSHIDPHSDLCDPVELAAVAVDLKSKQIIENSQFAIKICPPTINNEDYYELHKPTIDWHCKNKKITPDQLINEWKDGTPEKIAWSEFQTYIKNYGGGKSYRETPISGGMNIRNFDIHINNRLHEKYKTTNLFWKRDVFDLLDIFAYWFLYSNNKPEAYNMDAIRKHFKLPNSGSHEALFDTIQTAELICKFLDIFSEVVNEKCLI